MCVYCYHVIIIFCYKLIKKKKIIFCYKVRKIQEKKNFKLVIVQVFYWLSRHVMCYLYMNECGLLLSIINTKPMSSVYQFSLKYLYLYIYIYIYIKAEASTRCCHVR